MLSVLQIGPFAIQIYPLALIVGGWAALAIGARAANRLGLDGDHVYNAGLYAFIGGVLVGRLAHVVAFWAAYRTQPLEIFGFNTTAFLPWPAVIAAAAVAGWYIYRRRLPPATMLDAFAPGLLAGRAIIAVGELVVGRNFGASTDVPWAVTVWGVERHPVQVYEAIMLLGVAALLWMLSQRGSRPGTVTWTALLGYGLAQWFVGAFRSADIAVTVAAGLRLEQVAGLTAAIVALLGFRHLAAGATGEHTAEGTA